MEGAHVLPLQEQARGGGGIEREGGHPNQSTSLPPALSAEGPTDFCMQTHSRSQLELSLPKADKDSPRAALAASPIPAASSHSAAYRGSKNKGRRL